MTVLSDLQNNCNVFFFSVGNYLHIIDDILKLMPES